MATLEHIQSRAEVLSKTRDALAGLFQALQQNVDSIRTASEPEIRRVARQVAKQHNDLKVLIEQNPSLFAKPRTQVVDGLKFGIRKAKGKMSWADDGKVVRRIRELGEDGTLTPEQVDMCINTTEKPIAKALEQLDGKVLKRLGVTVASDADETVITSVDSAVEKAVNAVIKDITDDANAEVAT